MNSNLTGNTDPDDPALASVSRAVLVRREQIMQAWMSNVRKMVPQTVPLLTSILENTLPSFIDSLALLLTDATALKMKGDLGLIAMEHGGERARLTSFDTTALIHELQIFRDTLFAELDKDAVILEPCQRVLISTYIDNAIRESVNAFVIVQSGLREQFIAAMTHDLRTPLANAQMAAELIQRTSGDETVTQLALKIISNTKRIDLMSRQLLEKMVFGAPGQFPLNFSPFDMAELAREVASYAQNSHAVQCAVPPEPVLGIWCRESVRRALENLVNNAIKYGTPDRPIQLAVTTSLARVQVAVQNEGEPIPQEDTETIFQLYRRANAHEGTEGWGVGLPFVRRVAEAHGGSIVVSSTVLDGTCFVIDVPTDARPFVDAPSLA
jgi:signal transduction histidine kinase